MKAKKIPVQTVQSPSSFKFTSDPDFPPMSIHSIYKGKSKQISPKSLPLMYKPTKNEPFSLKNIEETLGLDPLICIFSLFSV